MSRKLDLGDRVTWDGAPGTIDAMFFVPSAHVVFDNGSDLWVGQERLTKIPGTDPSKAEIDAAKLLADLLARRNAAIPSWVTKIIDTKTEEQ